MSEYDVFGQCRKCRENTVFCICPKPSLTTEPLMADTEELVGRRRVEIAALFAGFHEPDFKTAGPETLRQWVAAIKNADRVLAMLPDVSSLEKERDEARAARDEAARLMSQYAREAGEATGRLEMSEAVGIVDGWRERATTAESQRDTALALVRRMVEGMEPFGEASAHLHPSQPDDGVTLDGIEVRHWRRVAALLSEAQGLVNGDAP
ncbi:hypothetical protein [Phenylobacterium sp.]|uniref:hypothetical protein n=1 Tax=Phenylobacterium sp. TaxID=1871053 RepID=UPI0039308920